MLGEAFNISLPVIHVLDLQILHTPTTTRPLLALLSQDTNSQRFLETFELLLREKDQLEGPWESWRLDGGAHTLVPVPQPLGGVVVLGTSSLTYVGGAGNGGEGTSGGRATPHVCTTPMNHTKISVSDRVVGVHKHHHQHCIHCTPPSASHILYTTVSCIVHHYHHCHKPPRHMKKLQLIGTYWVISLASCNCYTSSMIRGWCRAWNYNHWVRVERGVERGL